MPKTSIEKARVRALREMQILDTEREAGYDEIVKLAARVCSTPYAMISLIDHDRQWFKSTLGFELKETPREVAFCNHTIQSQNPFIIEDMTLDSRFKSHSMVLGKPFVRFYAGFPLVSSDGFCIGALCVLDTEQKKLTEDQIASMTALAKSVISQIEMPRNLNRISEQAKRYEHLVNHLEEVVFQTDAEGCWTFLNPTWSEVTHYSVEESIGRHLIDFVHPEDQYLKIETFRPLISGKKETCRDLFRYVRKNGEIRWVEVFARSTRNAKGEVSGISGTLTDITVEKLVNERIQQRECTLKSFFDSCPLMMGTLELTDNDMIYHSCNRETAKFLGVHESVLEGPVSAASLQVSQENMSVWRKRYEQARLLQKPVRFTCHYTNLDGEVRTLMGVVNLIPDGTENTFSFVVQDITEEKEDRIALVRAASVRRPEYA